MAEPDPWAPLLDPEWARTYGALERELDAMLDREHGCDCSTCHALVADLDRGVAYAWTLPDGDERARWLDAWGMTGRGAALRDALALLSVEALQTLTEMAEQARRPPTR